MKYFFILTDLFWFRSIFNDNFHFPVINNLSSRVFTDFHFPDQLIIKQHLVIIINKNKFPRLTYFLFRICFIFYINPILYGLFHLYAPQRGLGSPPKFGMILVLLTLDHLFLNLLTMHCAADYIVFGHFLSHRYFSSSFKLFNLISGQISTMGSFELSLVQLILFFPTSYILISICYTEPRTVVPLFSSEFQCLFSQGVEI